MKKIDLFFEVMLGIMFGALTGMCFYTAFVFLTWWHLLIAIMGAALTWRLVKEMYEDYTRIVEEEKDEYDI